MNTATPLKKLMNNENIFSRLDRIERSIGVQSPVRGGETVDEVYSSSGLLEADLIISPANDVIVSDPTSAGFTGVFMAGDIQTFGGVGYNWGTVKSGVLAVGANTDGVIVAGAGAVSLDEDGINIITPSSWASPNSIKWVSTDGSDMFAYISYQWDAAGGVYVLYTELDASVNSKSSDFIVKTFDGAGAAALTFDMDTINDSITLDAGRVNVGPLNLQSPTDSSTNVHHGTWTPAESNTTNLDGVTNENGWYTRIGNTVHCWGKINIDPTATGNVAFDLSIPTSATFGNTGVCAGSFHDISGTRSGGVKASTANNIARFRYTADHTSGVEFWFHFSYLI